MDEAYALAQRAMADLRTAIYKVLRGGPPEGMRNVDIGRTLGIQTDHLDYPGRIPHTLLELMACEGTIQQDAHTKLWTIRLHQATEEEDALSCAHKPTPGACTEGERQW